MKHYKYVKLLSNFRMWSPCTNARPPIEDFLATIPLPYLWVRSIDCYWKN